MSWTLGECKLSRIHRGRDPYTESCCLFAGIHKLTCDNSKGTGWDGGFIRIGGALYCEDFVIGYQQTFDVDISGNFTISKQRDHDLIPILIFVGVTLNYK